jgi:hypothetical protein
MWKPEEEQVGWTGSHAQSHKAQLWEEIPRTDQHHEILNKFLREI